MKLIKVRNLLTLGLTVKLAAVALALVLAGAAAVPVPQAVSAQENLDDPGGEKAAPAGKQPMAGAASAVSKAQKAREGEAGAEPAVDDRANTPANYDPALTRLIEQKRAEMAAREATMAQERRDLDRLRAEVNQRIKELKKVQAALEALVTAEQQQRRKRILQLVKVLSNMRGPAAAAVVEKLDDTMAVEIFKLMQSRTAGKVMANLKPTQAARISELLAREKKSREAARLAGQAAAQGAQPPPPASAPPGPKPARPPKP